MRAVILAAGASRRLGDLTKHTHKSLLQIGEKSLLENQLEALAFYGVREVLIVVGYLKEQIINRFGNDFKGVQITYRENPQYASTNTVYSLMLAGDYFMGHDFLYFNADVLFHAALLGRLIKSPYSTALAVEVKPCGEEEVKVIVADNNRIVRIGKQLDNSLCLGEFIGVAKFGAQTTADFFASLQAVVNEGQQMSFFEAAVDRILPKHAMYAEDITGIPVVEIDFPEDLARAREVIYPKIREYK